MVIALIPVPAIVANAHELMADQRITAIDTQILPEIALHQGQRGHVRIGLLAQVDVLRLGKLARVINPLPRFAVIFAKAHAQGIGLLKPGDDSLAQQRRIEIAAQFNIVGNAPGAG